MVGEISESDVEVQLIPLFIRSIAVLRADAMLVPVIFKVENNIFLIRFLKSHSFHLITS